MAAATVKCGFGTLFRKGSSTIAELTSITVDGIERDDIEVTHMESPDGAKEFIGGLTDSGTISVEGNFLPDNSGQKDLLTELYLGTPDTYSIVWIDGPKTWSFTAYVKSFNAEAVKDDRLSFTASFKITGKPTFPA